MNFKWNHPVGIILTLAIVITGIYIGVKHYKQPGFWYGVLALMLVTSYVFIGNDGWSAGGKAGPSVTVENGRYS